MGKIIKYRVGKLSKWHDLIRVMNGEGVCASTIRYVLEGKGEKLLKCSVYEYVRAWSARGFPEAKELGWGAFQITELRRELTAPMVTIRRSKAKPVSKKRTVEEVKPNAESVEKLIELPLDTPVGESRNIEVDEADPLGVDWKGYKSDENWIELLSGNRGVEKLFKDYWEMELCKKRISYEDLAWESLGLFDVFGAVRWGVFHTEPTLKGLEDRRLKFEERVARGLYLELTKKIELKRVEDSGEVRFYMDGGVLRKVEEERQDYLKMGLGWRKRMEGEGWVLPMVGLSKRLEGEIVSTRFKELEKEDDRGEGEGQEVWEKWRGWGIEEWGRKVRSKLG